MDIIKFRNPSAPTKMEWGEIVNGIKKKMWIERYAEAGEFTFSAPVSSRLKEILPIGTFVSHINTHEIMCVENHEIRETEGAEAEIVITGRGYETIFEQRVVGSNKTFPNVGPFSDYVLLETITWSQIFILINDHIRASDLIDDSDALPYITPYLENPGSTVTEERILERDSLYNHVLKLLAINKLGIKVVRPGPWSPLGLGQQNTAFVIHEGFDLTDEVIFSHDAGELVAADYLWSNKTLKNACLVTSTWVQEAVFDPFYGPFPSELNRRWMFIDVTELDKDLEEAPVDVPLLLLTYRLQRAGREALALQNDVALTKAEVSKSVIQHEYRFDYNVGDLVTVRGDYNETTKMRVTEYVEIEDETGESGHPTLSIEID